MLVKATVFLSVFLIIGTVIECYSEFSFADPAWRLEALVPASSNQRRSVPAEPGTERDREPLSPDYKDPKKKEEKPVLKPKDEKAFNPAIIPGGIVDVDASGGIGSFPRIGGFPEPDFGFSTFGSRHPEGGLFGLGGFFGALPDVKPWWKGPNVCIEREESTDDGEEDVKQKENETETAVPNLFQTAISLSNCHQTATKYECITKVNNHGVVKTFTVRYKCCYGYTRARDSSGGCTKQGELKPLLDTLDDLGAKQFRQFIGKTNMENALKEGNYTLFVPTDVAFNEYMDKMLEQNTVSRKRREAANKEFSSENMLLAHMTKGFVDMAEMVNEELINSEYDNTSLRINTYPTHEYGKMITVNCAKISKPDNLAENGIVHITDNVVLPATKTLEEIIHANPKLSNLRQVFESTDSFKHLRKDGHFTIFAPTDEAFSKLDEMVKQKILKGDGCAVSILKHHVTPHTVCSAAIIGNATTHNVEGNNINMERTSDDQLILEDKAKIIETDIMGTNGVIHIIDTVLIPESALHINEALKKENLTKFQELVEKAGLKEELDNLNNATVFAPFDEAFDHPKAKKYLEEIGEDREKLKELILYHTVQGQMQSCDMQNNVILKSNHNEMPLRLNLYSTVPLFTNIINRATVNCARLTGFDEKACGSVIHEVNKLLIPPTNTIYDLIQEGDKYTTLREIIKGTEIEEILKDANRSITFLAPTDETFAAIDEAALKTLMDDKEKATAVLKNHILTEVLCCSGVGPQTFGFNNLVSTVSHQHHQIGRTGTHQIRIGNAVVTNCDNLATNGVVHTVNKVLYPQRQPSSNFGGFFLFDF